MTSQHAIYPSLRGKNVLITGGAEGIGAAAVELFALNGSQVIILDISESSANTLITKITSLAKENSNSNPYFPPIFIPIFHQIDVSDLPSLQTLAQEILQKHKTIHILGYEPSSGDIPFVIDHVDTNDICSTPHTSLTERFPFPCLQSGPCHQTSPPNLT
jgi:D-arabinose 1-dehydrogenase-like Zn-dependent alcohol dehydrogenase